MAENPIRTGDLFEDDGTIQKVIEQLERLMGIIGKMQGEVSKSAQSIQAETKKTTGSQKQQQETLKRNSQEVEKLSKAHRGLLDAKKPIAKEIAKIRVQTQATNKLNTEAAKSEALKSESVRKSTQETMRLNMENKKKQKEMQLDIKMNQSAEGSYNRLSAQYAKLKMELNGMSHEQRTNTERGREMEMQSKRIYEEMTRQQMATGKHQLKVGSYTEAIRQSNMSLQEMRKELRMLREVPVAGKSHEEVQDLNRAIGELDDSMKKLQMEQEAYGMDNMEMIAGASRAATGAVGALAGTFNVLGIESEKLRGVQQNMQSMLVITQGLDAIEQAYHKRIIQTMAAKGKNMAMTIRDTAVKKYNAAATWLQNRAKQQQIRTTAATTAATAASATATTVATGATVAWTGAIRAFSRAVYNIPVLGWLLAIIGAIIAVVVALIRHWDRVTGIFRSLGQWTGIVKEAGEETETYEQRVERLTKSIERLDKQLKQSEKSHERQQTVMQREIDIMQALGASTDDIRAKEERLLKFQIQAANKRLEIARQRMFEQEMLTLAIITNLDTTKEESEAARQALKEQREAYAEIKDEISDLNHDLEIFHINETNRIRERRKEEREAARERVENEQKAQMALQELKAKQAMDDAATDKEREQAAMRYYNIRKQQVKKEAEMQLQAEGLTASEKQLIKAEANQKLRELDDEFVDWLTEKEDEKFKLLLEITEDGETKRTRELTEKYNERRVMAGDDKELLLALERWYYEQLDKIEAEKLTKEREAQKDKAEAEMDAFDQRLRLQETQFNIEERTQAEKERFRLKQDMEYYQKRLELQEKYGYYMTQTEVEMTQNLIQQVQRELDAMGDKRNIWELVGIDMSDEAKQSITMSIAFAMQAVDDLIRKRMEAAQAAVQAAETEVDAAQRKVDEERKALEEGHAHRLDVAERELEQAEKNQERALEQERKAQAAQARLQRRQQTMNLVTASTKIWADFGFPWALAALAVMWGSFFRSQRQAKSATTEQYGKGHFEKIGGGSHRSGRDTPLNIDGKDRRVERGEAFAVFNRRATSHYDWLPDFIEKANRLELDTATRDLVNVDIPDRGMDMAKTNSLLERMAKNSGVRHYRNSKGQLVEQKGNIKRIYA